MELEVGMYARLHGKIGKITHICMCEQCKLRGFYEPVVDFGHSDGDYISIYWKDDLKASHSIIDLIEVDDYVNGCLVEKKFPKVDYAEQSIKLKGSTDYIYDIHVKSIVTKEQFESMAYRIGE